MLASTYTGKYLFPGVIDGQQHFPEPGLTYKGDKYTESKAADTVIERMRQRLRCLEGSTLYKKRKQIVEPVFGIIKEVLGFRRFLLKGEQHTNNDWLLVCIGYKLKHPLKLTMTPEITMVSL
ncbi:transposase [Pedobacter caeni]|uniref:Transposase DDE domain-containing protein n=1 Tax=Pedobacter caeni TaxID=288992 RepID=A0A1M5KWA6_9SPHI|nr:transposase [Pedobacter caeni]SHG57016.1 Transposase DDE domain-containing protein [Pedobacter caeni]